MCATAPGLVYSVSLVHVCVSEKKLSCVISLLSHVCFTYKIIHIQSHKMTQSTRNKTVIDLYVYITVFCCMLYQFIQSCMPEETEKGTKSKKLTHFLLLSCVLLRKTRNIVYIKREVWSVHVAGCIKWDSWKTHCQLQLHVH